MPSVALVLADTEDRQRLHKLQAACEALTQQIAEAELELQTQRADLSDFEQVYANALRVEHQQLQNAERVVRALDRWADLLALNERADVEVRTIKRQERISNEVELDEPPSPTADITTTVVPAPRDDRLKAAFRALARRYHPDLARNEDERVRLGHWMARINDLYRARDLEGLLTLAEQLKGGALDDEAVDLAEQVSALEKRQGWLLVVLGNLQGDARRLASSTVAQLRDACLAAEEEGRDPFADLRHEAHARVESTMQEVKNALQRFEHTVERYNREASSQQGMARFDPYADRRLVRLGLEDLAHLKASPNAKRWAEQLAERFAADPAQLRLALVTYASDLSAYPLAGLEKLDDVRVRFDAVNADLNERPSFEHTLSATSDLLEWGVKHATSDVAYAGLRFVHEDVRTAMALLLRDIAHRRELKRVLYLLGDVTRCPDCATQVFALPLYRLRGLDDLRATVCPDCAHAFSSYWLARGSDVQSVLNDAFVDLEVIHEWSFGIGPGSIAMQLLPKEEQSLTVAQLKKRLHEQVFARNDLEIPLAAIELVQKGKKLNERLALEDVPKRSVDVRFKASEALDVVTVLETLKHRIRTRFRKT